MKLTEFTERFPWRDTRNALCREPSAAREGIATELARLVRGQRASQIGSLARLMISPVVASEDWTREEGHARADPLFEFRSPRRTSRLFLDSVTKAGKDVFTATDADLTTLDPSDAHLARLMRLLAVAASTPSRARIEHAQEWHAISESPLDAGPVLTPMLHTMSDQAVDPAGLVYLLEEALGGESGSGRRTGTKDLFTWTGRLLTEGGARLRELRGDKSAR